MGCSRAAAACLRAAAAAEAAAAAAAAAEAAKIIFAGRQGLCNTAAVLGSGF